MEAVGGGRGVMCGKVVLLQRGAKRSWRGGVKGAKGGGRKGVPCWGRLTCSDPWRESAMDRHRPDLAGGRREAGGALDGGGSGAASSLRTSVEAWRHTGVVVGKRRVECQTKMREAKRVPKVSWRAEGVERVGG